MAQPVVWTTFRKWAGLGFRLYPGILASLSSVPPVCPRPRPEIMGTCAPHAASIGASIRLTQSPTPPVECLSITGPCKGPRSQNSTSPESRIAKVSAAHSADVIPLKNTAIAKAPTCPSLAVPSVSAATKFWISRSLRGCPSRFFRITSCGRKTSLTVGYPDVLDLGCPAQKCPTLSNTWIKPVTLPR